MYRQTRAASGIGLALACLLARNAGAHGDVHEQIESLTARILRDPANAELLLRRGELLRVHKDFDAALADFRAAARLAPGLDPIETCAARTLVEAGRAAEAAPSLDRILARRPGDPDALLLRARAHSALGETERAAALYPRALAAATRPDPDLYAEASAALTKAGRRADALAALEAGIARLGRTPALELLALDHEVGLAMWEPALLRLDRLAAASARKETWLLRRAEVLEAAGRAAEARAVFESALAACEALPPRVRKTRAMTELHASIRAGLSRVAKS